MRQKATIEKTKSRFGVFRYSNAGKEMVFALLEELAIVPKVIFVTAYDEYAIKAFEYKCTGIIC